jgi:hypothetical protein
MLQQLLHCSHLACAPSFVHSFNGSETLQRIVLGCKQGKQRSGCCITSGGIGSELVEMIRGNFQRLVVVFSDSMRNEILSGLKPFLL